MQSRREFIRSASLLSGAAGLLGAIPASIARALAIEPAHGSSFLDAEHVVILMQENRSFDHCFGSLQGVRGFNDPRTIPLPDGNPAWVQADAAGQRYTPFRLDIKDTRATWMGSLPHTRSDQIDAWNHGRHDRWLSAKVSGHAQFAKMPLTLGYYTRKDLPFYYALADAFTICDQHFSSSLTGTTPNRLYFWTGTVRARQSADSPAHVRNEDVDYGRWASWTTFPERLEDHGVTWKVYQNELSLESGLEGEAEAWLANFTDNPLEWFSQYNVRFSPSHIAFRDQRLGALPAEIQALRQKLAASEASEKGRLIKQLNSLTSMLRRFEEERGKWTLEQFQRLLPREKSLHARAFTTNAADRDYRELARIACGEPDTRRWMNVPRGDVLFQFRQDVRRGELPTVSWLVAPERFSDHPSSAWYGAWYLSQVLDILTENPQVWKKTIFILTYDENDGYFDHVPPFTAPHPRRSNAGLVSKGIDPALEYVTLEQDLGRALPGDAREGPIGLGYRVPMIIASPWSRGGCVCSQVFDHTSVIQFLETFLTRKTGRKIEETNISRWRRAVCGDLTSAFGPGQESAAHPSFPPRDAFFQEIYSAQFKDLPSNPSPLTPEQLERIARDPAGSPLLPSQEPGVRRSCPLPYELGVDGRLDKARGRFTIHFEARKSLFGPRSAGAPFTVYALRGNGELEIRNYAVEAGEHVEDHWELDRFAGGFYLLRAYGPNGLFREFAGSADEPAVEIRLAYAPARPATALSGEVEILADNHEIATAHSLLIQDNAYSGPDRKLSVPAGQKAMISISTQRSFGWHDLSVRVAGAGRFERRYAGRVETGEWSFSDPFMGRAVR